MVLFEVVFPPDTSPPMFVNVSLDINKKKNNILNMMLFETLKKERRKMVNIAD